MIKYWNDQIKSIKSGRIICVDLFFLSRRFRRWRRFYSHGIFIHRMTRNLFGGWLLRRLLTDFRGCDLSGRCRYPLRVENVPQISQIYTDFSWDVFLSRRWRRFFSHGIFYSLDDTEFIRRFPAAAITYGFSRMRPVRSLQIPPESGKCPTDFTDIHRFFLGRFFVTQISQMTQIFFSWDFFSSDFTEIIRRLTAETITHGFSQMRPIRSLQIPLRLDKAIHQRFHKNLCISVKSVGQNPPHEEKSASSAKSAWPKQQEHI